MPDFPPLLAWAYGTLMGVLAQVVASRIRYNGAWDKIDLGLKFAMAASGGVAAAAIGLRILSVPPDPIPGVSFVYALWFWQIVAGWAGGLALDALTRLLRRMLGENGADDE